MPLPDRQRSRVVLIGASTYADENLPDLPAVSKNVADLAALLTDPTLGIVPKSHCTELIDEGDLRLLGSRLRSAAGQAQDLLLVYYAGHGLTASRRHDLYLALPDSDWSAPEFNSLEYDKLRDAVLDSPADTKVVILDCCFSGRAVSDAMADPAASVLDQIPIDGSYVLTSASRDRVALILPGERHTAFTGRLIRLLRDGVVGGPELLTIDEVYRQLLVVMRAEGLPQPQNRSTRTADLLALARNRAWVAPVRRRDAPASADGAPHMAMQRALVELDYQPDQVGAVMDYIAEQGLDRVTSSMKPAAVELLSGRGRKAPQELVRHVEAAIAGALSGQPETTRRAAAQAAVDSATGLTEAALIQVPVAGWRSHPDLISAARRTLAAPGSTELVSLAPNRVAVRKENHVTIQVQGRSVATLRLELSLVFDITAVLAQVRDGRLVELREGSAVISTTLTVDGLETVASQQDVGELSRLIPMSTGLRLLPAQAYPSDVGSVYWELGAVDTGNAVDAGKARRRRMWRS